MNNKDFEAYLDEIKMSKAEFSRTFGVDSTTVTRWKRFDAPKWAYAALENLITLKRLERDLRRLNWEKNSDKKKISPSTYAEKNNMSRQNLNYLIRTGKIEPDIIEGEGKSKRYYFFNI